MADLPINTTDLLNAGYSTATWCNADKVNRDENGVLIGGVAEAQAANRPTAEWGNGVSLALRQISTFVQGTASVTALSVATTFKLPVYTTAGRPAAGTAGRVIYDSDLDTLLADDGAAWDDIGNGTGGARSVLGRSANSSGTRADISGGGTASIPQVLSDDGSTVAFRSLQALSGSDVLYEVDLSSLATNAFADGTESIDGINWTVAGSAGAGTSWGVVNGQGIQWSAPTSSGQTWTTAAPNSPHLYVPLSSIPNWNRVNGRPLIVDAYLSSATFENGNDAFRMGIWGVAASPASTSTARARIMDRGNNGSVQTVRTFDGTTVVAYPDAAAVNAISALYRNDGHMTIGTGTYSGGWPTFDYVSSLTTILTTVNQIGSGQMRFALIFINASDASPTSAVTVARLRFRLG